jgi:hypothetical protein
MLIQQLKRKGAIRAAEALGAKNASQWDNDKLISFIDKFLLTPFHAMYKGLRPWYEKTIKECIANGKKATNSFGRTRLFFGDIANDKAVQRELSAYYGQSGTASNINRTMRYFYYSEEGRRFQSRGVYFVLQVHDSVMYELPPDLVDEFAVWLKRVMEERFTIHGRELHVRSDQKIGYSWGLSMTDYKGKDTLEKLLKIEEEVEKKYAANTTEKVQLSRAS